MTTEELSQKWQAQVDRLAPLLHQLEHREIDEKELKRLRVTTRRLRAFNWVLKCFQEKKSIRRVNQKLKKLGKGIGEVRKYDSAIAESEHYGLPEKKLRKLRKKAFQELTERYSQGRVDRLLERISFLRSCFAELPAGFDEIVLKKLKSRMSEIGRSHPKEMNEFHRIRIQSKKIRYVLEAIEKPTHSLVALQDYLGKMHDLYTLQELIATDHKTEHDFEGYQKGADQFIHAQIEKSSAELKQALRH